MYPQSASRLSGLASVEMKLMAGLTFDSHDAYVEQGDGSIFVEALWELACL